MPRVVVRGFIELVKAVGVLKAMHATMAIGLFAAALYVRWKYGLGFAPL